MIPREQLVLKASSSTKDMACEIKCYIVTMQWAERVDI